MAIYETLGMRRVINAAATLTRLGGSLMPPPVIAAMADAAHSFVDLEELQQRIGERIATLTNNQACYVSCGAAAGIAQAVAGCISGLDPQRIAGFPHVAADAEVLVHAGQRNGYDYAIRQTGAHLVEFGSRNGATAAELAAAITPRTVCIVYFAGAHFAAGAVPLAEALAIAHAHGVPLIVDAAAQIPPISNLWYFSRDLGVDLAIFSGGKGLRGPQSAGLVLGRADLVAACRANGSPNSTIGRPMKVGKEELAGMLAAVEWSLAQDEAALLAHYEAIVAFWIAGLANLPGVCAWRGYPSEAGQPHGRAIVTFAQPCPLDRDAVMAALFADDPAVAVNPYGTDAIALNPQTIAPGEEALVLDALYRILQPL
ncbi:MAG TPA: aminotransferase class V-fold PLP-dependent enzyme [Roseiflexaceae bacterium]|nr:aminotransferase class V-fold PLP-dependent enzyme [Roseiflexaceae bacterium]HMP43445.1 aminotransferase class V-fold PLP-dependent enzyme [Roseiflexaceae bacterium]